MSAILDWYVWVSLETGGFYGLVPWFQGDAQKEEHKVCLCTTSQDLVRVRTQTEVARLGDFTVCCVFPQRHPDTCSSCHSMDVKAILPQ